MDLEELNTDLLKLTTTVSVIEAEIKKDNESRKIFYDEVRLLLSKHNDVLFGNGREEGIVTTISKFEIASASNSFWIKIFVILILGGQGVMLVKLFLS